MRPAGRLHAPQLDAMVAAPRSQPHDRPAHDGAVVELRAPAPGLFVPSIAQGDLVTAGSAIGELVVLGRATTLLAPRSTGGAPATGIAVRLASAGPIAVGYGDVLVALDPSRAVTAGQPGQPTATDDRGASDGADGLVFRAPTSGRFYGRSAPDRPPFVSEGTQLVQGATICLLEVMKTFHRVTYGGAGLPDTARVRRVLVADGADVNAGEPLLALE
jgi:acetyl-CoA carboxylase biotin carboxyl carrier protein